MPHSRSTRPSVITQIRETLEYYPHILVVVGPLLVGYGFYSEHQRQASFDNSLDVTVNVVDVQSRVDNGNTWYRPVFEATLSDGTVTRYVGTYWHSDKLHAQGDIVQGRYSPSDGRIASDEMIEIERRAFAGMKLGGAATTVLGLGVFLFRRWRRKRA